VKISPFHGGTRIILIEVSSKGKREREREGGRKKEAKTSKDISKQTDKKLAKLNNKVFIQIISSCIRDTKLCHAHDEHDAHKLHYVTA
jgi:hypothetical protein